MSVSYSTLRYAAFSYSSYSRYSSYSTLSYFSSQLRTDLSATPANLRSATLATLPSATLATLLSATLSYATPGYCQLLSTILVTRLNTRERPPSLRVWSVKTMTSCIFVRDFPNFFPKAAAKSSFEKNTVIPDCWSDGCLESVSSKAAEVLLKWWLSWKTAEKTREKKSENDGCLQRLKRRQEKRLEKRLQIEILVKSRLQIAWTFWNMKTAFSVASP